MYSAKVMDHFEHPRNVGEYGNRDGKRKDGSGSDGGYE